MGFAMSGTIPFPASSDTAAVRPGEELDIAALSEYLRGSLGIRGPVTVEQFPSGHSNLTYLVRADGDEYVLRRAPLGPVAPKAHDMSREYRLLRMVHPHFSEAPEPVHLCEDSSLLGSVFFLMERRRGLILRDRLSAELTSIPNFARRVSEAVIDCLVRLHTIDVVATGLVVLGKPEGFLTRHVQGWAERWRRTQIDATSDMDVVIRWLQERLPVSPAAALIHNDYKLDNVMLGSPDHIEAVLDWEMATIGDPLADIGLTLCYWTWAAAAQGEGRSVDTLTTQPGWYTREQLVERYARLSGRDVSEVGYYEVLGVFKLAVILQQIYYRFRRGQTSDPRFANFGERIRSLISVADTLMKWHG